MFVISSFSLWSFPLSFSWFSDRGGVDIQKRKANKKYGAPKWESLQETAYLHIVLITQYTFGLNFIRASMHRFWEPDLCTDSGNLIGGLEEAPPPLSRFFRSEVMFVFQEICLSDWLAKFINCHYLPVMLKIAGKPVWLAKRSVMIRQEICPIRAEISTHKHGEKL